MKALVSPAWRCATALLLLAAGPAIAQNRPVATGAEIGRGDVSSLTTVRIGVREDSRPFAWRDLRPETAEGDDPKHMIFRGFLVELCTKAAIHAEYRPELVPVTAKERRKFLGTLDPEAASDLSSDVVVVPDFDVLCDPTTVSLSRMYRLGVDEKFVFSPILFVANSSFVRPNPIALAAADAAGKWLAPAAGEEGDAGDFEFARTKEKQEWLAKHGKKLDCVPGKKPDGPELTAGFVTGTTAEDAARAAIDLGRLDPAKQYCLYSFESHRDGMEAICRGIIGYYSGDIDIISAYETEIAAAPDKACKLVYTRDFLIYEPYALLVGEGLDGFRPKFIRELYRLFADDTVKDAFAAYFPARRASTALTMLFQINGIPMGTIPARPAGAASGAEPTGADRAAPTTDRTAQTVER